MKKKIISIILVAGMAVSLAACGRTGEEEAATKEDAEEITADDETDVMEVEDAEQDRAEGTQGTDEETDESSVDSEPKVDETEEQESEKTAVNSAYIDDGEVVIDIASYNDSYFRDNDIHLRRLEVNSDEPYIYEFSTYGTVKEPNDIWITKNVAARIDTIADEEEGYVDTIFTARISGIKNVDYLIDGENYDDDGAGYTYTISDNVFDFYTGASLFTYYQAGEANPEEEERHGTAKVELPDGTEGYISTWTTYEYTDEGKAVRKITVKYPVEYDGVVFLLCPNSEAASDEDIARHNSERGADVTGEIVYAAKTYKFTDAVGNCFEGNCDYFAPDKTAAELGID